MTADIVVEKLDGHYSVVVVEGTSKTRHYVTLSDAFYQKLTSGRMNKEQCIAISFRFLLDHEPKEAILSKFDLPLICAYFPEFEIEFKKYSAL